MRLQILVPSARRYGSTLAASVQTVARSTPSSSAHCASGAAIGRPKAGSSRSPPNQGIEHEFESEAGMLLTPRWALTPVWAALRPGTGGAWGQQRTAGDNKPQRSAAGSQPFTWGAKLLDWPFTRQGPHSWVQIVVRRDPEPMGETGATTFASISELRGFTAIAHYYPVGGVS